MLLRSLLSFWSIQSRTDFCCPASPFLGCVMLRRTSSQVGPMFSRMPRNERHPSPGDSESILASLTPRVFVVVVAASAEVTFLMKRHVGDSW